MGVRYLQRGVEREARAIPREVVVSAGTLTTPRLLMASGVGPAEHLREHGIELVSDVPGVGENLQDHLMLIMMWNVDVPTLNLSLTASGFVRHGLDFLVRGRGPAASATAHAVGVLEAP